MSSQNEVQESTGGNWLRKWSALIILSTAAFIIVIDTSIMNVSIKPVLDTVHTTVSGVQLAITMYALVMAASMIAGGNMGDVWGRKRTFLIGTVVFAVGSLLTSFSVNLAMLLVGWSVIEGLGAALMFPSHLALVAANYSGRERAICFGVIGGVCACAQGFGPIVGGWITTTIGWQWAFRMEVVVAALILSFSFLIKDKTAAAKPRLDVLGIVLSASGLGLAIFGILRTSELGLMRPRGAMTIGSTRITPFGLSVVPFLITAGIILLSGFIFWEYRLERAGKEPLVRPSLFKNRRSPPGWPRFWCSLPSRGEYFLLWLCTCRSCWEWERSKPE